MAFSKRVEIYVETRDYQPGLPWYTVAAELQLHLPGNKEENTTQFSLKLSQVII